MEQNRYLGDAIVTGHQQTGDEVVTSVASQVKHWQLHKYNKPSIGQEMISQHTISLLQARKYWLSIVVGSGSLKIEFRNLWGPNSSKKFMRGMQ